MAGRMRTSQAGLDLIMRFEGFRARSEALPGGGHVIGHGHTLHAKANQKITREDALSLLKGHDLPPIERAIVARSLAPLGQNEFDALVAFAFNIGLDSFLDSDVFALVNTGAKLNAAEAMAAWRKARVDGRVIVVDALVRRRAAERELFLQVPGGPTPVPTPIVRPILDLATAIMHPRDPADGFTPVIEFEDARADALQSEPEPSGAEQSESADLPEEDATPDDGPAEAAERHEPERLTRILGEDEPRASEAPADPDAMVEDITRAVSALADPPEDDEAPTEPEPPETRASPPAPASRPEPVEDDPVAATAISALTAELARREPDPVDEIVEAPDHGKPGNGAGDGLEEIETDPRPSQAGGAGLVDDLEPLDYQRDPDSRKRETGPGAPWGSLLLYGLSAFGGALIGAWGFRDLRRTMSSSTPITSDWALYAGPFAMLVGGLIFLIMGYYLLRAILSEG